MKDEAYGAAEGLAVQLARAYVAALKEVKPHQFDERNSHYAAYGAMEMAYRHLYPGLGAGQVPHPVAAPEVKIEWAGAER